MSIAVQPDFLELPERTAPPRTSGITHVLDKGMSVAELRGLLDNVGPYVDILKFGWGTAYVSAATAEKVELCRERGVLTCLGGTLLEIAAAQDRIGQYAEWAHQLGVDCVEVSNGALGMPAAAKRKLVRDLSEEFAVLAEVGTKAAVEPVAADWVAEMLGDLEAGAAWVIAEGRESGTVGLFEPDGEVRAELVEELLAAVAPERLIFEAPAREQQAWLIRRLGANVNLGNIAGGDVGGLETLRLGLRSDTAAPLRERDASKPRAQSRS
jgi:phosphosulfolactate synthase